MKVDLVFRWKRHLPPSFFTTVTGHKRFLLAADWILQSTVNLLCFFVSLPLGPYDENVSVTFRKRRGENRRGSGGGEGEAEEAEASNRSSNTRRWWWPP
jgi:hypothetical protein